jgi:hypothetical protein
MPALVKSTLGSSLRISGQLGSRVWPFASKNLMKRSRISALSISALLPSPASPAPVVGPEKRRV